MDNIGANSLSIVVPSSEVEMYGQYYERQGANSLSIVGRLSTLQSVHYQRFHCIRKFHCIMCVIKMWAV